MNDLRSRAREASFTQTIDGLPVATTFEDVIDPSTGTVFQRSPAATEAEINQAVAAARRAQPAWAALGWDAREALIGKLADAIDAEAEWLGTV